MKLSLVIPCHNEEEAIPVLLDAVIPVLDGLNCDYELVFVDDGSTDNTVGTLLDRSRTNPCIKVVELSRNFGKEAAMTAGFTYADGDAVIPIDADMQDPPGLIPELVRLWQSGYPVVLAIRRDRSSDGLAKRTTARLFYRLMSKITHVPIPENAGDYRLMSRRVVDAILAFPERNRFMKGLMSAAGFKHTTVYYDRPERAAGATKFNFWRLWNFALDGIVGYSTIPLRMATYVGLLVAAASFGYAGWIITKTLMYGVVTPGYATLLTVMLGLGGLQLIALGVLGEYVARLMTETKRRPLFFVSQFHGFEERDPVILPYPRRAGAATR